jgi:hypothetical protein
MKDIVERLREEAQFGWHQAANRQSATRDLHKQAAAEIQMLRARVMLLREAHDLANQALRSAWAVAEREGRDTNWAGHREQLDASLDASHAALATFSN